MRVCNLARYPRLLCEKRTSLNVFAAHTLVVFEEVEEDTTDDANGEQDADDDAEDECAGESLVVRGCLCGCGGCGGIGGGCRG